eukprot:Seg2299.5 transcript_id=Seg2299.5/GoldUCD/mRNA.D3Y31 product="Cation channel sperm-associated protein 2" protein_id=Seg2299.5/GoldUCD/D3Y31
MTSLVPISPIAHHLNFGGNKMADEPVAEVEEVLLLKAEIFRSKLIEHFQLLDALTNTNLEEEIPKYHSDEVRDDSGMTEMLRSCPNALIKFQVYDKNEEMTYKDKRLNRTRTKHTIPLGPWAKLVVENKRVKNFMLILIILDSIVLGIQAEISETNHSSHQYLKIFLDIFDYLSLLMFILEILLKWVDGFFQFWKNGWNVFDFFVTVMSLVPELIEVAAPQDSDTKLKIVARNLRTFRILRSLKVVSRFAQLRIIVLTMLKALKSMAFILMLLATLLYIFAVTGTVMFTAHSKSTRKDIHYKHSFSGLVKSILTLFRLFTLDHWFEILIDLGKTSSNLFSKAYIVLWICVGAFIFKNVFTGIMVMNFQNIRNEFVVQCKEHKKAMKDDETRAKLEEELARQFRSHSITSGRKSSVSADPHHKAEDIVDEDEDSKTLENSASDQEGDGGDVVAGFEGLESNAKTAPDKKAENENKNSILEDDANKQHLQTLQEQLRRHTLDTTQLNNSFPGKSRVTVTFDESAVNENDSTSTEDGDSEEYKGSATWNSIITANLHNLKNNTSETLWPRDSLFRYFQLMESLQGNLAERHQLQKLAVVALNQMHDGRMR